MGYRRTYLRRLRAAKLLEKRLAAVALIGMLAGAAGFMLLRVPGSASPDQAAGAAPARQAVRLVAATTPATPVGARRIYPYSIVPGGVSGRAELVHVLQTDRVVAVHYAGFQVGRTSTVTVRKPRAVYVSYRKGDKVYWTAKKVMLAQGETLLSDGNSEIRTRCGNRISDLPQMPVADDEPSAQLLDTAMDFDADEGTDDQRQAGVTSSDAGASGAPAVGQTYHLATFASRIGIAPPFARSTVALALLGMPGMSGAPTAQPERLTPLPRMVISAQTSVANHSGTSSDTSSDSSGDSAGTSTTITPVLGTDGDSSDTDGTAETPPLSDPLSPTGTPVVDGKGPAKSTAVPEPGSLWLGAAAVFAMLLLRRKPRRTRPCR